MLSKIKDFVVFVVSLCLFVWMALSSISSTLGFLVSAILTTSILLLARKLNVFEASTFENYSWMWVIGLVVVGFLGSLIAHSLGVEFSIIGRAFLESVGIVVLSLCMFGAVRRLLGMPA